MLSYCPHDPMGGTDLMKGLDRMDGPRPINPPDPWNVRPDAGRRWLAPEGDHPGDVGCTGEVLWRWGDTSLIDGSTNEHALSMAHWSAIHDETAGQAWTTVRGKNTIR